MNKIFKEEIPRAKNHKTHEKMLCITTREENIGQSNIIIFMVHIKITRTIGSAWTQGEWDSHPLLMRMPTGPAFWKMQYGDL